jgi:signal transduction histidine kinase
VVATWGIILVTVFRKAHPDQTSVSVYFQPRAAILVFSIIPFAVFHFRERILLITAIFSSFLGLLLFDPIHNWAGVGYYQTGHTDPGYYFTNIVFGCFYLFITISVGFLKKSVEDYEQRNEELIATLNDANAKAEEQNAELESKGYVLNKLLNKKDSDLADITQELAAYNQELLQYSYTISHNLRGPVSSILGLLNLSKIDNDEVNTREIFEHLENSAMSLDLIIRDLNRIVDERQNKFHVREEVDFEEEASRVIKLLEEHIYLHGVTIIRDFREVPSVFSVRSRINYILFCLITNAIQYRAAERPVEISIRTYLEGDATVLEIRDNGSGIDMALHKDDLFKPFKRFHTNASGKGLSLYLMKLQVDKIPGIIKVESTPDIGTSFQVHLMRRTAE